MKYLILALAVGVAGCAFHVDGDKNDGGGGTGGGGGGDVDMSMPSDDLAGGGDDLAMGSGDMALPIICTAGSASCAGSTLVTCPDGTAQMMTTCALGCSTTGGAHCNVMYPRAPVTRTDFDATGLTPVTLTLSIYMGTDNGQIGPTGTPLRQANNDPNAYEVHQGIGFHQVAIPGSTRKLGIYTFKSLTVNAGVVVNVYGTNGLALVSSTDVTIDGEIDATCAGNVNISALTTIKPWLAGPGGGAGGQPGVASVGFGSGGVGGVNGDIAHAAGGGGGAYADIGGAGGAQGPNGGGASGPTYGDGMLTTLLGGSGGGAGGQNGSANSSYGGGGGGLVLVVAQGTATLGAGSGGAAGVNAGGCGGTAQSTVGGGGGGSGGMILVQALAAHVAANGVLAANGGSGAAGNAAPSATTNGKTGAFGATGSTGGQTGGGADGGNGSDYMTTRGANGGGSAGSGGGAGAGVGRIRVETQGGATTIDAGGVISPVAVQGTVDIH